MTCWQVAQLCCGCNQLSPAAAAAAAAVPPSSAAAASPPPTPHNHRLLLLQRHTRDVRGYTRSNSCAALASSKSIELEKSLRAECSHGRHVVSYLLIMSKQYHQPVDMLGAGVHVRRDHGVLVPAPLLQLDAFQLRRGGGAGQRERAPVCSQRRRGRAPSCSWPRQGC